jgi:hypothetical protein
MYLSDLFGPRPTFFFKIDPLLHYNTFLRQDNGGMLLKSGLKHLILSYQQKNQGLKNGTSALPCQRMWSTLIPMSQHLNPR